ncbi:glycoside hydrolase family 97 catalytic domain-containing protein [Streptosporangium subroseum]|uniref:glycoside hydrolase family 97 catalytic domain-containing protein n=1 Tax=Streptosporangium subroseum TaxID=106412 RepID=UPI003088636C|nr:glycoside hydrolase family 97 catalytic domain-containing protein [Streptosporangium subroseum]
MSRRTGRRRPRLLAAVAALGMLLSLLTATPALALATHSVSSPNGQIAFSVTEQTGGSLTFAVTAGATSIFGSSPLGIATLAVDLRSGLGYVSETRTAIDTAYSLPAGTKPSYRDHANELTLRYSKSGRTLELVVRAYDDGIAYRYRLPGSGSVSITDETGGFRLPVTTGGWAAPWNANYEQDYTYRNASQLNSGTELTMPLLASIADNSYFTVITEAQVVNANASYVPSLLKGSGAGDGLLNLKRTPDQAFPISTTYPFETPWRAAIIAGDLDTLYNSDLVQNLNPPATADSSWVRPGRAAWSWYADEDSASDLDKQREYVDFAESMGFEYVTMDCCYDRSTDLPVIAAYARQRGVGMFAWVNAEPFADPAAAEALMAEHKGYGIDGLKVDFFLSDSKESMGWYQSIGQAAANHRMMLNFHGSTKPGGENRSWPWLVTSEAVAGTEHYLYPPPTTARQDVTYPFIRNMLGGMDYTPTMISENASILTQGHTLAQAVVFTSAMVNYADSAAAYEQWDGRWLMRALPTTWDETKVVEGFPGDHITVARRSGDDWFVGAMTSPARTATVPLSFLGSGTHTATIFSDNGAGRLTVSTQTVTSATTLSLPMIAAGGVSVHISKTPLAMIGSGDARYEAESASNTRGGGAGAQACKGCSGGQKVGNIGSGGSVQFNNVMAATAGTHRLTFTYTSGDPRSVQVRVNGATVSTENVKDSGGWEHVGKWSLDVPLNAGANTVTFLNASAFSPDIDALTIARTVEAEAAANTRAGGAVLDACPECTGGTGVSGLAAGSLSVPFQAASSGDKTVRIHYASAAAASIKVTVNGGTPTTVALHKTGGGDALATATVGLPLGSGANTILIKDASGATVTVDSLDVVM